MSMMGIHTSQIDRLLKILADPKAIEKALLSLKAEAEKAREAEKRALVAAKAAEARHKQADTREREHARKEQLLTAAATDLKRDQDAVTARSEILDRRKRELDEFEAAAKRGEQHAIDSAARTRTELDMASRALAERERKVDAREQDAKAREAALAAREEAHQAQADELKGKLEHARGIFA